MKLKLFLKIFGFIAIALTILPFFGANYWWIRIFDFPHLQLTGLTLIALLSYFFRYDNSSGFDLVFPIVLTLCFAYQLKKIYPYTPIAPQSIASSTHNHPNNDIKLYTANVLQKNKRSDLLLEEVARYDADVLLFTEVNNRWNSTITQELSDSYHHKVEYPLENTYGMSLYSKFQMIDPQIMFLVSDSVPSIKTIMILPSGDSIQFYAIHPTPPLPQHNPKSTDRDAQMMKIALLSREEKLPVIVMGDFNDVAWSSTTQLFEEVSGLLDLRKGRGFYNTFDANNVLLRWPLDHIFISDHFRLLTMERGGDIESDHFPFYTHINIETEIAEEQRSEPAKEEQLEKARKISSRVDGRTISY